MAVPDARGARRHDRSRHQPDSTQHHRRKSARASQGVAMDFNYSPEDEAFRRDLRVWLEANRKFAPPPSEVLGDERDRDWDARVRWHKKLNEGGWVAVHWPKEYGGRGATVLQRQIFREELE